MDDVTRPGQSSAEASLGAARLAANLRQFGTSVRDEGRLRQSERAKLRDWYDQSGQWIERMSALYALVEAMIDRRTKKALALGWEQGWVARGNGYEVGENPHATPDQP